MFSYDHITLDPFRTAWLPAQLSAAMLRLDKIHPEVSGNKWFKLKYNIAAAKASQGILTFGGAYSNHIAATALACREAALASIGIIRGEEHQGRLNHTLQTAANNGMELVFVSREAYRNAAPETYASRHPGYYVVPEGGHNALGAKGCEEILSLFPTSHYTHILCAVGTGTTLAGLINSAAPHQQIIGIPVLKGATYLEQEVATLLHLPQGKKNQTLLHDHHLGGYAKKTPALIDFINTFYAETGIPTDIIYTGKLVLAFHDLVQQGYFPAGSQILLIHTGGLQGNLSLAPGVLSF